MGALVDGRAELADELSSAEPDVRAFITCSVAELLAEPRFIDAVHGSAPALDAPGRVDDVILPRLRAMVSDQG